MRWTLQVQRVWTSIEEDLVASICATPAPWWCRVEHDHTMASEGCTTGRGKPGEAGTHYDDVGTNWFDGHAGSTSERLET
jgi:hypothetical protein